MPVINGMTYPDTFLDVTKNKDLRPHLLRVIKNAGDEGYIEMIKEKPNAAPKDLYAKFFDKGAKYELRALTGLCKAARHLARENRWDETSAWQRIHKEARRLSFLNLDQIAVPEVYRTRGFARLHVDNIKSDIKLTPAMIKTLGVSDKKGLTDLIVALRMNDAKTAEKIANRIIKSEKLTQKPNQLVATVAKLTR